MVDAQHIENGLVPYVVEQLFGEIADIVLPEVPHREDPRRDAGLGVGVAAVTEILPQVFTVPEPLHKLCGAHRRTLKIHPGAPPPRFLCKGQRLRWLVSQWQSHTPPQDNCKQFDRDVGT